MIGDMTSNVHQVFNVIVHHHKKRIDSLNSFGVSGVDSWIFEPVRTA